MTQQSDGSINRSLNEADMAVNLTMNKAFLVR